MTAAEQRAVTSLAKLLEGLATVPERLDRPVRGLTSDSRAVRPGDVFLACAGQQTHGLAYLRQAREQGCTAVLWEPPAPPSVDTGDAALLEVANLGAKVGQIGSRFFGHPSHALVVLGVTGTDGKTSCVHFLAQCLTGLGERCGVLGTLGCGLFGHQSPGMHTTPEALTIQTQLADMRGQGARYVAMEVSSHALDQERVAGTRFALALLTNLTRDHLDYHGDLRAYAESKRRLFRTPELGAAVLNVDDDLGLRLSRELEGLEIVAYGTDRERQPRGCQSFVLADAVELGRDGCKVGFESSWGAGSFRSPLLGRFNVHNLLAVLSCLLQLGFPLARVLQELEQVTTAPGRMERLGLGGHPLVVVDYAHTPHSLGQVLQALREHCEGRLICVFGCGGERDRGKRAEMGRVAQDLADRVIVTDDNPRREDPEVIVAEILDGMDDASGVSVIRDRAAAIREALQEAGSEDTVLVAGKGHESHQIVGETRRSFSDQDTVRSVLGYAQ